LDYTAYSKNKPLGGIMKNITKINKMKKIKIISNYKLFSIGLVIVLLLTVFYFCNNNTIQAFQLKTDNPLTKSQNIQNFLNFQSAFREIYKVVNPSVVRIETEDTVKVSSPFFNDPFFRRFFDFPKQGGEQKRQGLGSGFFLDEKGYIATNNHVIKSQGGGYVKKIIIKLTNGKKYKAKVIGSDESSDIALLKIDPDDDKILPAFIGNSEEVETGDFAIAIGNPFGLSSTFTMGFISSKSQEINTSDGIPRIQTDAAINPGNSGGPLINLKGEVIGINQMIYSRSGGSNGIGFAIPINYAMDVLGKLKSGKKIKHGFIGVAIVNNPSPENLKELGLKGKTGLLIGEVHLGSPAWKSGLRPFDFIIKIDGKKVEKFAELKSTVVKKGPGKTIQFTVIRDSKTIKKKVKIGQKEKS
jgi:S1-C subfamily serine protease